MQSTPVAYKTKESFTYWWPFWHWSFNARCWNIFQGIVGHIYDVEYIIICDDQVVPLVSSKHDQRGQWIDPGYGWDLAYDSFTPCDRTRKPGAISGFGPGVGYDAYIVDGRFIYVRRFWTTPKDEASLLTEISFLLGNQSMVICCR